MLYTYCWRRRGDYIDFNVTAQTTLWVGIGVSLDMSMVLKSVKSKDNNIIVYYSQALMLLLVQPILMMQQISLFRTGIH